MLTERTVFEPFPETAIERSVSERFIEIARRFPERIAVADEAETLTYAQLAT